MAQGVMEQFAEDNGMILIKCDPVFGGRWGYVDRDNPKLSSMGFKTKRGAYQNWYRRKFGEENGIALLGKMKSNDPTTQSSHSGGNSKG